MDATSHLDSLDWRGRAAEKETARRKLREQKSHRGRQQDKHTLVTGLWMANITQLLHCHPLCPNLASSSIGHQCSLLLPGALLCTASLYISMQPHPPAGATRHSQQLSQHRNASHAAAAVGDLLEKRIIML